MDGGMDECMDKQAIGQSGEFKKINDKWKEESINKNNNEWMNEWR